MSGGKGEETMKANRLALGALLSCALVVPAAAQFHDVAFTTEHGQGWARVDTTVAASPSRIVVATCHRLELRNRDGSLREGHVVDSTSFPFVTATSSAFRDPRAEYDSANDRLWVIYWDGVTFIHAPVYLGSFSDTWDEGEAISETGDWHYFTGPDAIDLGAVPDPDLALNGADHPIINIDEDWLHISAHDATGTIFDPEDRDAVASIPLNHSGGSMLSGA